MWSDWLVFCDYGFHFVCLLMEKDERHMEASWWEASWLLSFRQRWIHAPHSQKCTLIEPCSLIAGSFDSGQRLSCFLFSVNPHDSLRKVYSSSHFIMRSLRLREGKCCAQSHRRELTEQRLGPGRPDARCHVLCHCALPLVVLPFLPLVEHLPVTERVWANPPSNLQELLRDRKYTKLGAWLWLLRGPRAKKSQASWRDENKVQFVVMFL